MDATIHGLLLLEAAAAVVLLVVLFLRHRIPSKGA
jgi:hypothetical protein